MASLVCRAAARVAASEALRHLRTGSDLAGVVSEVVTQQARHIIAKGFYTPAAAGGPEALWADWLTGLCITPECFACAGCASRQRCRSRQQCFVQTCDIAAACSGMWPAAVCHANSSSFGTHCQCTLLLQAPALHCLCGSTARSLSRSTLTTSTRSCCTG